MVTFCPTLREFTAALAESGNAQFVWAVAPEPIRFIAGFLSYKPTPTQSTVPVTGNVLPFTKASAPFGSCLKAVSKSSTVTVETVGLDWTVGARDGERVVPFSSSSTQRRRWWAYSLP